MSKHKVGIKTVTLTVLLHTTWIIIISAVPTAYNNQHNNTDTNTNAESLNSQNISRLSNGEALELLLSAYLAEHRQVLNTSQRATPLPISLQPALLDYENETEVEDLAKIVANQTMQFDDIELPADVYEVPLEVWISEEDVSTPSATQENERQIDETQRLITETLRQQIQQPSAHTIRHRSRRVATRSVSRTSQTRLADDPVASLPIKNLDINGNILNLLRQQQRGTDEATGSLDILRQRSRFNITVEHQAPFQNIEAKKLMEIVILMRSDCSQVSRKKKMIRWVSGMRGILFECQNGAWVVTYLSRRNRKPRPTSVTDCHEIHMEGRDLDDTQIRHQLVIHYSNGERKSKEVMCRHDDRHTNHQLIDNHINPDPDHPVSPIRQTISGAWTVIQRRVHGRTKFYRSMKRYRRGFGSVDSGEYWLGLAALHEVTHTRDYMLRVEVTTSSNLTYYSEYSRFRIGSEAKSYRLRLGAFIEPANSTLSSGDFLTLHHGGKFHTRDSDKFAVNCAKLYGTAFWFRGCWAAVNLNGPYITTDADNSGVRWATANPNEERRVWKTEMMIKPIL